MQPLAIPVFVGTTSHTHWAEVEARREDRRNARIGRVSPQQARPPLADPGLSWTKLGFEPRWVGDDTTDCVVALEPSAFHSQGADEFNRFRRGAASRDELALVFSTIGRTEDDDSYPYPLAVHDSSVHLPGLAGGIGGRTLGNGARIMLHHDLSDANRDLGLRLLNHSPSLNWSNLDLHGDRVESAYGVEDRPAQGCIQPILVTALGEPVVGVWVSDDEIERRYIVPAGTPWELILNWLREKGLPEHVPGAMRRALAPIALPMELLTSRERQGRDGLASLEASYERRRGELQTELDQAQADAEEIRHGLFYGTSTDLVRVVAAVLAAAGIHSDDLDELLGGTHNADLLCSYEGAVRLVEVKSASGRPNEKIYNDLLRHLREWPNLHKTTPVDGGVLILNHEYRLSPLERSPQPYTRPEFLAAQTEPIVTAWQLFEAWRDERWEETRAAIFGQAATATASTRDRTSAPSHTSTAPAFGSPAPSRWWHRLGVRNGRS